MAHQAHPTKGSAGEPILPDAGRSCHRSAGGWHPSAANGDTLAALRRRQYPRSFWFHHPLKPEPRIGQFGSERLVVENYSAEMLRPAPISTSILNRGREVIPLTLEPGDSNDNGSPIHPVTWFPSLEVRLVTLEDHYPFL